MRKAWISIARYRKQDEYIVEVKGTFRESYIDQSNDYQAKNN